MSQVAVVCVVLLFSGIIMVLLSRFRTTETVTVFKYLPRDLDTYLREEPYASVSEKRIFDSDDWLTVTRPGRDTTSTQMPAAK